jgi:putative phage-type endonuclease
MMTIDWDALGLEAPIGAPAIVHSRREQWLMERREIITASDAAAILGVDPYRLPSDIYLEKTGLGSVQETEPMRWGKRLENAIAAGYVAKTRRRVHDEVPYEVTRHPDIPWLGATLDRGVTWAGYSADFPGERGPEGIGATDLGALELKATGDASKWDDDESPLAYQIQLTVQMACSRRRWGSLAAFVSIYQPVTCRDHLFDAELFALMVPKLEQFRGYVQRREPPTHDPFWFSHDAIRQLWPADSGESIVLLIGKEEDGGQNRALALVEEWEKHKEAESAARVSRELCENALRLLMQDASTAYLKDGTSLNLKTVAETVVETYTRKAFRTLRRLRPKGMSRKE